MSGTAWGAGQQLDRGDFSASFNGKKRRGDRGHSAGQELRAGSSAVVLAIDTSGSMLPDNIERAKAAADAFATRMEPGTRMGVVAFSDQPVVVQELTSDLEQVRAAIRGLTAQGDTALYDAVILSSRAAGQGRGATEPGAALGRPPRRHAHDHHAGDRRGQQERGGHLHGRPGTRWRRELGQPGADGQGDGRQGLLGRPRAAGAPATRLLATTLASQYVVKIALPPGLAGTVDFRLQVRANGATGRLAIARPVPRPGRQSAGGTHRAGCGAGAVAAGERAGALRHRHRRVRHRAAGLPAAVRARVAYGQALPGAEAAAVPVLADPGDLRRPVRG